MGSGEPGFASPEEAVEVPGNIVLPNFKLFVDKLWS
jgi:hypothetical protein